MKKRIVSIGLSAIMLITTMFSAVGCARKVLAEDCMKGITACKVEEISDYSAGNRATMDFAVGLFRESATKGQNSLVSPFSVMCALAMVANGADKKTLEELEATFGITIEELNSYIYSYVKNLPSGSKYKLSVANSIWFKNDADFKVEEAFLQKNADYYNASVYKSAFDARTLKDMDAWCLNNTDGMLDKVVASIPPEAIMYLINAVVFDAKWEEQYKKSDVWEGAFTLADGTQKQVDYMHSTEHTYIKDEYAEGFVKYYKDNTYAWVALLPNEDVKLDEYVAGLTGTHIGNMLENAEKTKVETKMPKFKMAYNCDMVEGLKRLGIKEAFDANNANFSKLGTVKERNIYIDSVAHKTYIEVDENGTKAAALTAVGVAKSECYEEVKTVYLNRPFFYMIVDCQQNVPVFMGTMQDVKASAVNGDSKGLGESSLWKEDIGEPVDESQSDKQKEYTFSRVCLPWKGQATGGPITIESRSELESMVAADGSDINEYTKYDDKFFENNMLVATRVYENSGSIGHKVTGVRFTPEGMIIIDIERTVPEVGTCDMATWRIVVELEK